MAKNRALLSSRTYAYRADLSAHDAIQYISAEFSQKPRLFLAEFDFSKYFDTISHEHLRDTLRENNLLMTPQETVLIEAFLQADLRFARNYETRAARPSREYGLPQGTSISLFLANVAASGIDKSLERIGVGFARYADDTLIWSKDYAQICEAANILLESSSTIGSAINHKKSHGIRIYTPNGERAEMESANSVEFVGYRFNGGKVGLRQDVVDKMTERIQMLIWENLLQALQEGTFKLERVNQPIDRDYAVLILQIRRYLYGNLTEKQVRELQRGSVRRIRFPGLLSYFPLINDLDQQKRIDGWILSTIHQALRKRGRLIQELFACQLPLPHGLSKVQLSTAEGQTRAGMPVDLRMPSVARMSGLIYRSATAFGANAVAKSSVPEDYHYW